MSISSHEKRSAAGGFLASAMAVPTDTKRRRRNSEILINFCGGKGRKASLHQIRTWGQQSCPFSNLDSFFGWHRAWSLENWLVQWIFGSSLTGATAQLILFNNSGPTFFRSQPPPFQFRQNVTQPKGDFNYLSPLATSKRGPLFCPTLYRKKADTWP